MRILCAVMFIGHGLVCWNGQMPLRALLWDEELFGRVVVGLFGMEWGAWVSSMDVDAGINRLIRGQAWIFFAFALATLIPLRRRWWVASIYPLATANLAFLAWLKFHDLGMGIGQFVEHASQFFLPAVLGLFLLGKRWIWLAQLSLAATFIGHGLYALDLPSGTPWLSHPRPGSFTEMTMVCLGLESEQLAGRLLWVAGLIDMVVALAIFAGGRVRRGALAYMAVWGFLTALARPWAHYEPTAATETLIRWVPEMLYRFPHFGLPLCLLLALRRGSADN